MTSLAWLIPAALTLGGLGLAAFLWSLKSGQYDDLEGAAWRALEDRPPDAPEDHRHAASHGTLATSKGHAPQAGALEGKDGSA